MAEVRSRPFRSDWPVVDVSSRRTPTGLAAVVEPQPGAWLIVRLGDGSSAWIWPCETGPR